MLCRFTCSLERILWQALGGDPFGLQKVFRQGRVFVAAYCIQGRLFSAGSVESWTATRGLTRRHCEYCVSRTAMLHACQGLVGGSAS